MRDREKDRMQFMALAEDRPSKKIKRRAAEEEF